MAGGTQDRIIVHASLDMFDDEPSPSHARSSRAGSSQPARSSGVAVQSKRDGLGGSSRAKHVGYANRHIQRHNQQDASPKRALHRAQLQVGPDTSYRPLAAGNEEQIQPELLDRQKPTAVADQNGDHRSQGHFTVADEDDQQVHTPPRWRRISAATPSAPQQEYPTSPSIRRQGNGHLRYSNPQRHEGGRPPTDEDVEYSPNGYSGGVSRYGGDQRAAREPGPFGDHSNQRERDYRWGGSRHQITSSPQGGTRRQTGPYPTEGPEHHHYHGPETHDPFRGGHSRHIGGGGGNESLTRDEGRRRDDREPEPYPDTRHGETHGSGRYGTRVREQSLGRRGKHHNSPPGRYRDDPSAADDESLEDSRSGSSDRRSNGSRGVIHSDGGRGKYPAETGRNGTKHADASGCRQRHTTHKTQAPFSSVRRQLLSPRASPLQNDGSAPRKVQQRVKISPARQRPAVAEIEETKPKPESLNEALVKSPKDMLLFSKKARQVDYKPCTLKEYRESKPTGYVELGKLQPDLYTDELVAKRANAERIKEFSANLRKINSDTAAARRGGTSGNNRGRKGPAQDSRSKGLAFASRIPLPKTRPTPRKNAPSAGEPDPLDPTDRSGRRRAARRANGPPNEEGWESRELTELEALEREHDEMRRRVQAARSLF